MIGIYCWTNKITGEQYVGQSIDITHRRAQHLCTINSEPNALHNAMKKYGTDNFIFSILEECGLEQLDQREIFWIQKLNTYLRGYNMTNGGQKYCSIGENNPNTNLTNQDVLDIRNRIHINQEYPKDVYKDYETLVSYDSFWALARGKTWKNVDCSMIKSIPINNHGSKNPNAKLNEQDVINARYRRYIQNESINNIYQDYQNKISRSAFNSMIRGNTWKHIPIPKK